MPPAQSCTEYRSVMDLPPPASKTAPLVALTYIFAIVAVSWSSVGFLPRGNYKCNGQAYRNAPGSWEDQASFPLVSHSVSSEKDL